MVSIRGVYEIAIRVRKLPRAEAFYRAVDGPVHHEWMGAKSLYFADPDGHDLELLARVGSRV